MRTIKITTEELEAIEDMCSTIETMIGCAESLVEGEESWDDIMNKNINLIRKMYKRNKFTFE